MKESIQKQREEAKRARKSKKKTLKTLATHAGPAIRVLIGTVSHRLTPDKLDDITTLERLAHKSRSSEPPQKVYLDDLLRLTDRHRFQALEFASQIQHARYVVAGTKYRSLLGALLSLPCDGRDLESYTRFKFALVEAAVLCHADALEACVPRIVERLRSAGAEGSRKYILNECRRVLKELQRGATAHTGSYLQQTVRSHYADAPVSSKAVIPAGWQATVDGIVRAGDDRTVLAPLLLTERGVDAQRGVEMLTITWMRDGQWQSRAVDRVQIADSRGIVGLAAFGVPVTSNNAKQMVQFLANYEEANIEHVPVVRVTSRMGWQGERGSDGFLWGHRLVTAKGENGIPVAVRFQGAEPGIDQLANGLHQRGELAGWLTAMKGVNQYPAVALTLYASLVPPMLPILQTQNHCLDLAGPTTTGKTSALRIAASVWGAAHEGPDGSMLATWDATAVWRERAPEILNNHPLILDETKHVRRPEDVAATVYSVCQGRGRGRGTIKGIAHQGTWATVLMSSGEQPLTSFTQDGGTRARVLTLWGSPFGSTSQATGRYVAALTDKLRIHYGHAGPTFVRYLAKLAAKWEKWRARFLERERHYRQCAGQNTVAGRMAAPLAAIYITSQLVHKSLDLPWDWSDPIKPLYGELVSQSIDADHSAAALQHVYEWGCGNPQRFFSSTLSGGTMTPHGGWAGVWQSKASIPDSTDWPYMCFLLPVLQQLLIEAGYDPTSIVRQWRDRGWLYCSSEANGRRNTKRMRLAGASVHLVAVRRSALIEIGSLRGGAGGNGGGNSGS